MATPEINQIFTYKDTEYQVKKPSSTENKLAQTEYSRVFAEAVQNGALLKKKLQAYMIDQKIWDEKKTDRFFKLADIIAEAELSLKSGGISLNKAVEIAKQMKLDRAELQEMIAERSTIESSTAEGQAENARFQKLLTVCLVYKEDGRVVFNTVDDLLNEQNEDRLEVAAKAFDILGQILYKLDDKFEANLPENKFLREWNFMDDKLRFIKNGKLVDYHGRPIDDQGRLINEKGELVDGKGNLLNEEGEFIPKEVKPFLDEEGNPLTPPRKL
jgi:hypothetical protein